MKVLLVEDDARLAASLVQGLRENGYAPVRVAFAAAARAAAAAERPDLVILDLGLPDGDGLQLLQEWRQQPGFPPILITTAREALAERLRGLDAGADDYLVKPYAFAELLARMRVQLRHAQKPATHYRVADLELDLVARAAKRGGQTVELSPREWDLLAYLAGAQGEVVSRETLALAVWKVRAWTPSLDNVIDVHISRLREKIDGGAAVRLLHTARGRGFYLKEEP